MLKIRGMLSLAVAMAFAFLLAGAGQVFAQPLTCGTTTWDLTAGQYTDVGSIEVCNDLNNVYVKYTLDYPNATFGNLQMWAGNSLVNLPANQNGTPIPGQFCSALGGACFDATGLRTYTFTIPFSSLSIVDANAGCGSTIYVVTHAEVDMDGDPATPGHETAFGGPTPGGGPRWWFYGQYAICCDFGAPPSDLGCNETAFAKGGYVWTTDRKSNPESLPSLGLIRSRWGWAINLQVADIGVPKTYDIWAGAGLNNTANGTKVGTLTVNWDGTNAAVTYTMLGNYKLQEVHLYAGDTAPTITAPGQYGYLDSFDPLGVSAYTFNVPLADTNGTGGVWLIAHAVVSGFVCAQ